jgi:hypothetical protein
MVGFITALFLLIVFALGSSVAPFAQDRLKDELQHRYGLFESLDVKVVTDPPFRAVQGEVDQLRIDAKNFRVEGIPIAAFSLRSEAISLNMGRLFWASEVDLARPTGAIASITLTEQGLNELIQQPVVTRQLKGLPVQFSVFPGMAITQKVDIIPQDVDLEAGRLQVTGVVQLSSGVSFPFQISGRPLVQPPSRLFIADAQASMMGGPVDPSLLAPALKEPVLDLAKLTFPQGVGFSLFDVAVASDSLSVQGRLDLKGLLGKL